MDSQRVIFQRFEDEDAGFSPRDGINDISASVERCMMREGRQPLLALSVGGNNIGRVGNVEIFRRFRETLGKIRNKCGIPIVCRILQRCGNGDEWLFRAISLNSLLAAHCNTNGRLFIYTWNLFSEKEELYAKDRMHLSFQGVDVLSDALERTLSFLRDFFSLGEGGTLKKTMNEVGSNMEEGEQVMDKDLRIRVDISTVVGVE